MSEYYACTCEKCIEGCRTNPGWMDPEDASRAIAAELAPRLMLDWLEPDDKYGNDERIYILAPASRGCEGEYAPVFSFADLIKSAMGGSRLTKGVCNFLTSGDRCELHDTGMKPWQCRGSTMCKDDTVTNYQVAKLWETPEAMELVERWKQLVKLGDHDD